MLISCLGKNPLLPSRWSSLPLFFLFLVWSTLQQDNPFLCNYNIFLFLCTCLLPLHWGPALECPKPTSFSYFPNFPSFSSLQTLQSLLFSIAQNLMPFHTSHPISLNFSVGWSQLVFMLVPDKFLSLINPLALLCYIWKVLSRWWILTRSLWVVDFPALIWSVFWSHWKGQKRCLLW